MIHFIRDTRGMEKYRILNWLNYIFYVNILVQSVLKLLQVFELIDMLIITHVLIVIVIIILEICLYKEYQNNFICICSSICNRDHFFAALLVI